MEPKEFDRWVAHTAGWTHSLAVWNTLATVIGAVSGWVAIGILVYLELLR